MDDEADFRFSSYREHVLEHQLIGEILRDLWLRRACAVEVLRAEVDAGGYDVVLEYQSVVRHIQLKATRVDGKRASVGVNIKLRDKPSGCVIWFHFAQDTMRPIGPFRWLGGPLANGFPILARNWAGTPREIRPVTRRPAKTSARCPRAPSILSRASRS